MSKKLYEESDVKAIADAIRAKNGETDTYKLSEMAQAVTDIPSGDTSNEDGLITRSLKEYSNSRITTIGHSAFAYSNLVSINCPLVTEIGHSAFAYCSALLNINIPLLNTIDKYAFTYNKALSSISLSAKIIEDNAFASCTALTTADLPRCTYIGQNTFGYSNLTYLYLRNTDQVCTLYQPTGFNQTPIAKGSGHIYVPESLVESYKSATNWSNFADCVEAIPADEENI